MWRQAGQGGRRGVNLCYRRSRPRGEENLLTTSFAFLSVTLVLGALLLSGQARGVAPIHGLLGLAGAVAVVLAAWRGGLHGAFATIVLVLLLGGLGCGVLLWRGWRAGLVLFVHVMAGGLAYLLLVGVVFG